MADLGFQERYDKDQRFQEAVDRFREKLVFHLLGVDPESLVKAWNGTSLNIDPRDVFEDHDDYEPGALVMVAADDETVESPVKDLTGADAEEFLNVAAEERDIRTLIDAFNGDDRIGVAMTAARLLHEIRTES